MNSENRRYLPGVDKILASEPVSQYDKVYIHSLVLSVIRKHLDKIRQSIKDGGTCPTTGEIIKVIADELASFASPGLIPVINATGVVLHTNLGRAPLSQEAIEAMKLVSEGYCNLEFDLESGKRGSRRTPLERLLCQITGAEAALAVNNNASALLLGLSALAKGKEVIVSRGQAVEIGGGFRVPDVMRQSGVKLVEVGATNCTHIADYEQAITPRTVALLRVHSSNFKIIGFTENTDIAEMVQVANRHNIFVMDDLGSGCLLDTAIYGLDAEPLVQESIAKGVALAFFSGDKLLGGPQAGIIVGRKELVDKLARHPLMRALRIDKTRIAALEATLLHYLKGEAVARIAVWKMIAMPLTAIEQRAKRWAAALEGKARVIAGESMIGGGSLPGSVLPTFLVSLQSNKNRRVDEIAGALRENNPPIIARIENNSILLDPRTVEPEKDNVIIEALKSVFQAHK